MARRVRKKLPKENIECVVTRLSHEGRGISKLDGKTQFIEGALIGETVKAKYLGQKAKFDELQTIEIISPSPKRVDPPCRHAETCGGCSMQHMASDAQIEFKQSVLVEQFEHFGNIEPDEWQAPMTGPTLRYRGKARLGVRYAAKRDEVLVGFREKRTRFLADIHTCEVLDERVGEHLMDLRALIKSLDNCKSVPQLEFAAGDEDMALVVRHTEALSDSDKDKLIVFSKQRGMDLYLQPEGPDSVYKLWPENGPDRLYYRLPVPSNRFAKQMIELAFHPLDFTQVNAAINRKMVDQALEWLEVKETDRVLDLFCGLGNFTIPLATQAQFVVGVEGVEAMVARGMENAERNSLDNLAFYCADLQTDFSSALWAREGFDKILIDPPRSGALDVVNYLAAFGAERIVYVSCNPATLARDTGILIEHGYRLKKAGVMDMFPHTSHVESMALFEKAR